MDTNSSEHPLDRKPNRQERDLPTTASDDYLTPAERRKAALFIKRVGERARERLLTELDPTAREGFEGGVVKARRRYRSGQLLTFRQFCGVLSDLLDDWED